jgi:ATP-dependent DNA ligase
METFFQDVIDKGGEGIILRDPTAPYESGRSKGYLKHKVLTLPLPSVPPNIILRNSETLKLV